MTDTRPPAAPNTVAAPRWSPATLTLAGIVALAAIVRLLGAWSGNLMYDESTHLACAQTIDLRPDHLNIVWRSVDHPFLSVYFIRLSGLLFGTSLFGLRLLHVLVGTATIVAVYKLAQAVFADHRRAALLAAAFLAVDQFHQTWSYFMVPEVLLMFFATLTLRALLLLRDERTTGRFVAFGVLFGLCYVAKETAVFLAPPLWIALVLDERGRAVLKDWRWYGAHGIALLLISPDIWWNVTHFFEGYVYRDAQFVAHTVTLSPRAALMFVGELVSMALGSRYESTYLTQNPAVTHWPAGLFYIASFGLALRWWRDARVRLLLVVFAWYVVVFTLLSANSGNRNYWWASIVIIPATVLAGRAAQQLPRVATALLIVYLSARAVQTGLRPGLGEARLSAGDFVRIAVEKAQEAEREGNLRRTEWRLLHTAHIAPPNPVVFAYLADISEGERQRDRATYFARRSLELDPQNERANAVLRRLQR